VVLEVLVIAERVQAGRIQLLARWLTVLREQLVAAVAEQQVRVEEQLNPV
jgi:hypothetical protein